MSVFVPNGESQGQTATWLIATANESGVDRRSIETVIGGFLVPDELAAHLNPDLAPSVPVIENPVVDLPEVGSEFVPELPVPDVEIGADGKVYLTEEAAAREQSDGTLVVEVEVDREAVRAWAKEQGLNPAEKGALKKEVYASFRAAHGN